MTTDNDHTEVIAGVLDGLAVLRKPFPSEQVGQLPKPYSASSAKGNCNECGGYHGLPAAHLDFVGHADLTARLLDADPFWTWEPFALDNNGLPAIVGGDLWIRLTVCGVTRIGIGDGKSHKERIGDALRNAAMRFGAALDLWAKGDRDYVAAGGEPDPEVNTGPPSYVVAAYSAIGSLDDGDKALLREWVIAQGIEVGPKMDEMSAAMVVERATALGSR